MNSLNLVPQKCSTSFWRNIDVAEVDVIIIININKPITFVGRRWYRASAYRLGRRWIRASAYRLGRHWYRASAYRLGRRTVNPSVSVPSRKTVISSISLPSRKTLIPSVSIAIPSWKTVPSISLPSRKTVEDIDTERQRTVSEDGDTEHQIGRHWYRASAYRLIFDRASASWKTLYRLGRASASRKTVEHQPTVSEDIDTERQPSVSIPSR